MNALDFLPSCVKRCASHEVDKSEVFERLYVSGRSFSAVLPHPRRLGEITKDALLGRRLAICLAAQSLFFLGCGGLRPVDTSVFSSKSRRCLFGELGTVRVGARVGA